MHWGRVFALVLRYTYLYRRSVPRLIEMVFWPMMDLLVWGFVTAYLLQLKPGASGLVTFLLGAMIFWDILYRSQQGLALSFLEDLWSRNILNLFASPIRLREFLAATFLVGLFKVLVIGTVLTATALGLYRFNLLDVGPALVPFFVNLVVMGWAVGMVTVAIILRFGIGAEALAWAIPFFLQPLAAVFYPVDVLPGWLQPIALSIPATHVFEGMRHVLRGGDFPLAMLARASMLNVAYLAGAAAFFVFMFRSARNRGHLAKLGMQ
ncbi:MAG: ABC transporter permease [Verrucomicrobiae bacterium]|nr:ABC transporter permease [Verrucomicrobiae bacterium]